MLTTDTREIFFDKSKLRLYLAGACAFILIGNALVLFPDAFIPNPFFNDPRFVQFLGAASIALFGALGFLCVQKLRDTAPGLVLTAEGFTDRSGSGAGVFVPWADVAAIRETDIMGQKLLAVILRDPNAYIERYPNAIKRSALRNTLNNYGSPIQLSASTLLCSAAELHAEMTARLADQQARA